MNQFITDCEAYHERRKGERRKSKTVYSLLDKQGYFVTVLALDDKEKSTITEALKDKFYLVEKTDRRKEKA